MFFAFSLDQSALYLVVGDDDVTTSDKSIRKL